MDDHSPFFLDELRQPRPDPGGAAAAAYAACVGLALLEKIVRLEQNRQRRADVETPAWPGLLSQVRRFTTDLAGLREEDVQAYLALAAARSQTYSRERLSAATEEAIRCPTAIARKALLACNLVAEIAGHCQKHLLADLRVAGELLGAAAAGAHHIARANLPLLPDPVIKHRHEQELTELGKQLRTMRQSWNETTG